MQKQTGNGSIVVLVHGTYAADASDIGDAWWQTGSPCWNALRQRLPAETRLPEQGEVFHWSGENSERARSRASADLLEHLLRLETAGQSYHLVGHSHGGSVIAGMLRLASLRRTPLANLGSWTTVGTPYLHARTRSIWNPVSLVNIVIAIALLAPLSRSVYGLVGATTSAAAGTSWQLKIPYERDKGYMAVMRAPALKLAEVLGVPSTRESDGIRLGSYEPGGEMSFGEYLFLSREGLTLFLVASLQMYVLAYLAAVSISPVLESLRIRAEHRLERETARTYGDRWLGLWSQSDEAINGLRATIDFSMSFVGRLAPRERIFFSDNLSLITRPYYWFLGPVYNRTARPFLDRFVRRLVVRTAQGNNRPTAEIVQVSPLPFLDAELESCPPLPGYLERTLVGAADSNARELAPKLRQLLGETRIMAGLEAFGQTLSGKELIHTSYFNHDDVLDLIAMNICWSQESQANLSRLPFGSYRLFDWFAEFKQSLGASVNFSTTARCRDARRLLAEGPQRASAS